MKSLRKCFCKKSCPSECPVYKKEKILKLSQVVVKLQAKHYGTDSLEAPIKQCSGSGSARIC
jgi:hypothetical protein